MPPQRTIYLFRVLFVCASFFVGLRIGDIVLKNPWEGGACGLIFGLAGVLVDCLLKGFSLRLFSSATFGLLLGVLASQLLLASNILHYTSDSARWVIGLAVYGIFGYLGMMLAVRSHRDEFALIIPYVRFRKAAVQDVPLVVDASVLMDGQLLAVCETGFLGTSLVVPRFVLEELQRVANASEPGRREKGRRALELLNEVRSRSDYNLTIHELDADQGESVDSRLIRVAKVLDARLLTSDSSLAQRARFEKVPVLSLRELSHALRPVVVVGDELELTLVKPGRESHQAVGYLSDGGMVVVNHARELLGSTVRVVIGSILQTPSGRMMFAEMVNQPTSH